MRRTIVGSALALGIATAATVGVATTPEPVALPAANAWTCSDGDCRQVNHKSPDDGYDSPIPVQCGTNLIRYDIAEGQSSLALGCNDVNRIGAKPGHKVSCWIGGDLTIIVTRDDTYTTVKWAVAYGPENLLCVDGAYDAATGGGGGGGGGGGS